MSLCVEAAYTFKHALTHQVTYESLLQERWRGLHARIVEALEALAAERLAEQVDRLAHHALRGEAWDKAFLYCRQAGVKAARSAHREAVAYFEQTLGALQHLPESRETREQAIDLRFNLRASLEPLGEYGRLLDYLREAETLAEALDDRGRLGHVFAYLINYLYDRGTRPRDKHCADYFAIQHILPNSRCELARAFGRRLGGGPEAVIEDLHYRPGAILRQGRLGQAGFVECINTGVRIAFSNYRRHLWAEAGIIAEE
jgi:hypothetical protein